MGLMASLRAVACTVLMVSTSAMAAEVVVDFDEIAPGSYFNNLTSHGFRISPSCHVDIFGAPFATSGNAMGWDRSGCGSGIGSEYLGTVVPDSASVFIDYFEQPFAFTSFFLDQNPISGGGFVTSSKGGLFSFSALASGSLVSLSGSDWLGLNWIQFNYSDPGAPIVHLDALTFAISPIPEPATYAMLALGLAFVGVVARRSRRLPD